MSTSTTSGEGEVLETVAEVYDELVQYCTLLEEIHEEDGLAVECDTDALMNAAQSYVYDLDRYKRFHELVVPDTARRCAYLCKWVMRFRPVIVRTQKGASEELCTFALMANETLATLCATGRLENKWDTLSTNIRTIFAYSLRYRSHSEDTFILFFAMVCDL